MGLNRDLLGKKYSVDKPVTVDEQGVRAYALATNTDNARYLEGGADGRQVAPPMYGVVASLEAVAQAILDPDLGMDVMRMLHGEQEMRFLQPLRVGDQVRSEVEIGAILHKRTGELLELAVHTTRLDGTPVYDAVIGLFLRGEGGASDSAEPGKSIQLPHLKRAPEGAATVCEAVMQIADDQSLRYADASGDHNPIHKDDDLARAMGLPGRILHGLCTMAMAQNAIIDHAAAGDPGRLRRLRGRFSRPVLMGDTLTTRCQLAGREGEVDQLVYEVVNQSGKPTIKEGYAELQG